MKQRIHINEEDTSDREDPKAYHFASNMLISDRYNKRIASSKTPAEIMQITDDLDMSPGIAIGCFRDLTGNETSGEGLIRTTSLGIKKEHT